MKNIIIGVVAVLTAAVFALFLRHSHAPAGSCAMDNDNPPFSCFDQWYDEYPGTQTPGAADSLGLPMGWHLQLAVFLNSRQQSPKNLPAEIREDVRNILFAWVGVQKIEPASRGLFIDARELAFIEKITGEPFVQTWRFRNPFPIAATAVKEIFGQTLDYYTADLLRQFRGEPPSGKASIDYSWEDHYDQGRTFFDLARL